MSRRKSHIPERDHGTHISVVCGQFRKTLDDCFGDGGVCKRCRKDFMQTPEQIKAYGDALMNWGNSFNFSDEAFLPCPTHPKILVHKGHACRECVSISNRIIAFG